MEKKTCYGPCCNGKEKSIEEFNKNKSRADGLQSWCKQCQRYQSKNSLVTNINPVSSQVKMMEDELRKKDAEIKKLRETAASIQEPDCDGCKYLALGKAIEQAMGTNSGSTAKQYTVNKDGTVQFVE